MAMVINSNIQSLNAQRNLTLSQGEQSQAMERLTSGKRINSAADDAAGLSIANRMTSQVRGLDQAIRNANDGISMIQTAEGALDETTNILQRMRELSVQSANGTYDSGNRATMDAEVKQLISEIDRISETTKFNGLKILDGTLGQVDLQAGADANETISLEIGAMDSSSLGSGATGDLVGTASTLNFTAVASGSAAVAGSGTATETMTINGQVVEFDDLNTARTMDEYLNTINSTVSGVEASSFVEATAQETGDGVLAADQSMDVTVLLNDGTEKTFSVSETGSMDELVSKLNEKGEGLLSASLDDAGKLVLTAQDAAEITVVDDSTSDSASGFTTGTGFYASIVLTDTDPTTQGITVEYSADADALAVGIDARSEAGDITASGAVAAAATWSTGDFQINGVDITGITATEDVDGSGARSEADVVAAINKHSAETGVVASLVTTAGGTANALNLNSVDGSEIEVSYRDAVATTLEGFFDVQETNNAQNFGANIANVDISTAAGAQKAIGTIDAALEQINATRGDLGAVSNRLDFTVNNLSNVSENVAAARSRIEDADFAKESANLSRAQVLQQAGTAMLAQANAAPQQVLSLLQ